MDCWPWIDFKNRRFQAEVKQNFESIQARMLSVAVRNSKTVVEEETRAEKPIKLADVAKAAGVSHGTASNVFSRPAIVREEVRERVLAAAHKLGYGGPDPKGRLLRAGKVNAIGVATAEPLSYFFDDPFARVVMSGISQACEPPAPAFRSSRPPIRSNSPGTSAARWSTVSSCSASKAARGLVELTRERKPALRGARFRLRRRDDRGTRRRRCRGRAPCRSAP